MGKKLFTAIVFFQDNNIPIRKYRNIANINSFYNFCVIIDAEYFNLYEKTTRLFAERIYIKKGT
jgi:hypothetical protein